MDGSCQKHSNFRGFLEIDVQNVLFSERGKPADNVISRGFPLFVHMCFLLPAQDFLRTEAVRLWRPLQLSEMNILRILPQGITQVNEIMPSFQEASMEPRYIRTIFCAIESPIP